MSTTTSTTTMTMPMTSTTKTSATETALTAPLQTTTPTTLSILIKPEWCNGKSATNTINLPLRAAAVTVMMGPTGFCPRDAPFSFEWNLYSTVHADVAPRCRSRTEETEIPTTERALLWFDGSKWPAYKDCVVSHNFAPDLNVRSVVFRCHPKETNSNALIWVRKKIGSTRRVDLSYLKTIQCHSYHLNITFAEGSTVYQNLCRQQWEVKMSLQTKKTVRGADIPLKCYDLPLLSEHMSWTTTREEDPSQSESAMAVYTLQSQLTDMNKFKLDRGSNTTATKNPKKGSSPHDSQINNSPPGFFSHSLSSSSSSSYLSCSPSLYPPSSFSSPSSSSYLLGSAFDSPCDSSPFCYNFSSSSSFSVSSSSSSSSFSSSSFASSGPSCNYSSSSSSSSSLSSLSSPYVYNIGYYPPFSSASLLACGSNNSSYPAPAALFTHIPVLPPSSPPLSSSSSSSSPSSVPSSSVVVGLSSSPVDETSLSTTLNSFSVSSPSSTTPSSTTYYSLARIPFSHATTKLASLSSPSSSTQMSSSTTTTTSTTTSNTISKKRKISADSTSPTSSSSPPPTKRFKPGVSFVSTSSSSSSSSALDTLAAVAVSLSSSSFS